jgi:protocatechuate 3,4-dioxygenase beta subunit
MILMLILAACAAQPVTPVSIPVSGATTHTPVTVTVTDSLATALPPAAEPATAVPTKSAAATLAPTVAATAVCAAPARLTPAVTEGPYFKAGSPERTSLYAAGMVGTKLTLTGYVLSADCKPVAHALLDFWQADANGVYDNAGFTLRGRQYSDANGLYRLETVIPGLYTGRTEHIHVKVQAPGGPLLTSQLFFPGVLQNDTDGIYDARLLVALQVSGQTAQAQFNFVIAR